MILGYHLGFRSFRISSERVEQLLQFLMSTSDATINQHKLRNETHGENPHGHAKTNPNPRSHAEGGEPSSEGMPPAVTRRSVSPVPAIQSAESPVHELPLAHAASEAPFGDVTRKGWIHQLGWRALRRYYLWFEGCPARAHLLSHSAASAAKIYSCEVRVVVPSTNGQLCLDYF